MDWKAKYYWPVISVTAGTSVMVIFLWWLLEARFNRCYEETMVHREWRAKKAGEERDTVTAACAAGGGRQTKHIRDLELRLGRLRNGREETFKTNGAGATIATVATDPEYRRPDEKSDFAYGSSTSTTYWD